MAGNTVKFRALIDDKVSSTLDKIRDKFDQLGGKGSAASLFGNVGAKAVAKGFDLVGDAAGKAIEFIGDSVDAASNLRESMSLTTQVFEDQADEMSKWGDTSSRVFGQSKREALQYAANFGTAFKNVGFALDETADKSQKMTRLAADLGSAFNASSEEAATALRSGLLGESEPLRRFGVFLDENRVKAKALQMGLKPLHGELTQGQKVAARYAIIMEDTGDSQGMFGRDTDSLADAQKSLTAAMEELQASIGRDLLPVLKEFTAWLRDEGIPWVKAFVANLDAAIPRVGEFGGAVEDTAAAGVTALRDKFGPEMDALAKKVHDKAGDAGASSRDMGRKIVSTMQESADAAKTGAGQVGQSIDEITRSMEAAEDRWAAIGAGAADAFFDPQIAKLKKSLNTREIAETRAAIKSGELRGRELEEARLHVAELQQRDMELLAELASYGDKKAAQTLQTFIDTERAAGQLSAKEIAWLDKLEAQLKQTAEAARRLTSDLNRPNAGGSGSRGRASGGPVWPGVWTVGEEGPETLVMGPNGSGYVLPNTSGGGGGGTPMTMGPIHTHVYLNGREIAMAVDAATYRDARRASITSGRV